MSITFFITKKSKILYLLYYINILMGSKLFDDFYYNLLEKSDIPWDSRRVYNDFLEENNDIRR